jgi:hypothetical protein
MLAEMQAYTFCLFSLEPVPLRAFKNLQSNEYISFIRAGTNTQGKTG